MKIQVLKEKDFPSHDFFKHLRKGTEYYQNSEFGRAIEEWQAADRHRYLEPVQFQPIKDRVFFGCVIEDLPLLFCLYAIYANRVTGIGLMKNGDDTHKFVLSRGALISAATSHRASRIGNYVLRRKKLSLEHLEALVGEAKKQKKKLGRLLVERELISLKALHEILTLQFQEIIGHGLFRKKGHFYFFEKKVSDELIVRYSPLKCALIAAKRGYNFTHFKRENADRTVVFRQSPYLGRNEKVLYGKLNTNEKFILSLIDGIRNIEQIRRFSRADEVSLMNILYRLSAMGLIRKTREIGEYEDKEFKEISRLLTVFLEIYKLIAVNLFQEMGKRGEETIQKTLRNLKPDYQLLFMDVPLNHPTKLGINPFLRNMASHFPSRRQRTVFIDAFYELFVNILDELARFLGTGLAKEAVVDINRIKANLKTFSAASPMKDRSFEVLDMIIKKYS